ncbi:uncharacterized protein LOC118411306 isoform X4 [Branchiostoma floridae]|uniref:Uncharacterized protein LOC118411306 isoform X4 n=1 Tax=Branchiostoma floridae TaxID=7739 RepID=A0A9J7MJA4_BRAFL|nr:uncharacterized protein LOC118411306 isoform X4 [Branchiostoma floridae]
MSDQAKPRCAPVAPTACLFCAPGRKIEKSETTPYGFDMDSKDKELTLADATTQPRRAHDTTCTPNCVSFAPNTSKKGKKKKSQKGPYGFDIEDIEDEDLISIGWSNWDGLSDPTRLDITPESVLSPGNPLSDVGGAALGNKSDSTHYYVSHIVQKTSMRFI